MITFGKWIMMVGVGWFFVALIIVVAYQVTGFTGYAPGFEWIGLVVFVLVYLGLAFYCPCITVLIGVFFIFLGTLFDRRSITSVNITSTSSNTHTNRPSRRR